MIVIIIILGYDIVSIITIIDHHYHPGYSDDDDNQYLSMRISFLYQM